MPSFVTIERRWLGSAAVIGLMLLFAACSPTYVTFEGPPGSVMYVNDQPYNLPRQIELWRPAGVGDAYHNKVKLIFPTNVGDAHAEGTMDVFGYTESDADRYTPNVCKFEDSQMTNLANGTTLVYKAKTASRQPLFDLTLMKK